MEPIIRTTKKQRDAILACHNGVGHLIYKVNEKTTCEVGFFIKNRIPYYLTTGKPIEYDINEETEE